MGFYYRLRYILSEQLSFFRVQAFEVSIPPRFPVPFRLPLDLTDIHVSRVTINPPSNNDDVTSTSQDGHLGGTILLTQTITRNVQSYAGCQDQKVFSIVLPFSLPKADAFHAALCYEADDEVARVACHPNRVFCIRTARQSTCC